MRLESRTPQAAARPAPLGGEPFHAATHLKPPLQGLRSRAPPAADAARRSRGSGRRMQAPRQGAQHDAPTATRGCLPKADGGVLHLPPDTPLPQKHPFPPPGTLSCGPKTLRTTKNTAGSRPRPTKSRKISFFSYQVQRSRIPGAVLFCCRAASAASLGLAIHTVWQCPPSLRLRPAASIPAPLPSPLHPEKNQKNFIQKRHGCTPMPFLLEFLWSFLCKERTFSSPCQTVRMSGPDSSGTRTRPRKGRHRPS